SKIITKKELCLMEKIPASCGIVIFGASGDLAHRKLLPSLFNLLKENVLPKNFYVLGLARTPLSDDAFRSTIRDNLPSGPSALQQQFLSHCTYMAGDYNDPRTYAALKDRL